MTFLIAGVGGGCAAGLSSGLPETLSLSVTVAGGGVGVSLSRLAGASGLIVEAPSGYDQYSIVFKEYDGFGNLKRTIDPRGVVVTNTWDALGRLLRQSVIETNGNILKTEGFAYEPGGQVVRSTNALGGVTQLFYTTTGKAYLKIFPNNETNGWTYYSDGRPRREYQSNGAYWETTYDDANRRITRIFYSATPTALATNITEFDRRDNVFRRVDASGNSVTNLYDGLDRLKAVFGPVVSSLPPEGVPSSPGGDPPPVQQASTNYYDATGLVQTNVNALGEKAISYFDVLGRLVRSEIRKSNNALVRETSTFYSADHQSVTITNGSGTSAIVTTMYTDTQEHPVLSLAYPSTGVTEFTYSQFDVSGNLIGQSRKSSSGGTETTWWTTSFIRDGLNRTVLKIDKDNAQTQYAFDGLGDLTNRVAPGGVQWRASYNNAGQRLVDLTLSALGAASRSNSYAYYGSGPFTGLLLSSTDGRGVTCLYSYDDYLRPITNTYSGTVGEDMISSFEYDVRGLLKTVKETFSSTNYLSSTVSRTYDPYGKINTEVVTLGPTTFSTAGLQYDSAGRRSGLGFGSFGYGYTWQADGALLSASGPVGSCNYTYNTAGELTSRQNGILRYTGIDSYDGLGRPTSTSTIINGHIYFQEQITYTGDGLVNTHQMGRYDFLDATAQFTDSRSYTYAPLTRRLVQEVLNLGPDGYWTNNFTFDNNAASGAGVLTKVTAPTPSSTTWSGTADAFSRIDTETNAIVHRPAYGNVNGQGTVTATLDGRYLPVTTIGTNAQQWRTMLEMGAGPHQFTATATHPSGLFVTNKTIWVTNNATDRVNAYYGQNGELTNRVWKNANGTTNRSQTLTWDARGRLLKVGERDSTNSGKDLWIAYDGLGRRLQTKEIVVTNGVALTATPINVYHYFDPAVEFLELGVNERNITTWKIMGPDFRGGYGAQNGTGGFDAICASFYVLPTVSDVFGNIYGAYDQQQYSYMRWNASRVAGYGGVPGYRPVTLGTTGTIADKYSWRNRAAESVGYVWMGANWYDPESGQFLAYDNDGVEQGRSAGHNAFNGNPIGFNWDSDGRIAKNYYETGGPQVQLYRLYGVGLQYMASHTDNPLFGGLLEVGIHYNQMGTGMLTPATYFDQAYSDYQAQGGGTLGVLGEMNRYNPVKGIFDAASGIDMINGSQLSTSDRWSQGLTGVGGTLLFGVGIGYDIAQPPPTPEAPPVINQPPVIPGTDKVPMVSVGDTGAVVENGKPIYRVVTDGELDSVNETGKFSTVPGSSTPLPGVEGKWFYGSLEDAQNWATQAAARDGGPLTILQTTVQESVHPAFSQPWVDGIKNPALFYEIGDLNAPIKVVSGKIN